MGNAQCPITNECPMPNDESHYRPDSPEWGPGTAEALSGRATSAGKQRHGPLSLAIGYWSFTGHWLLAIGYWPPKWFDRIRQSPWSPDPAPWIPLVVYLTRTASDADPAWDDSFHAP